MTSYQPYKYLLFHLFQVENYNARTSKDIDVYAEKLQQKVAMHSGNCKQ